MRLLGLIFVFVFGFFALSEGIAQESGAGSSPSRGAPQIVTGFTSESTNFMSDMGRRFQLSYWSMFSGPSFGTELSSGGNLNEGEELQPMGMFHQIVTGFKLGEDHVVGLQLELSEEFGSSALDSSHNFTVENPKIFWNHLNFVDNTALNLQLQWMVEGIVEQGSRDTTAQVGFQANQVWQIKTPNPDWFVSLNTSFGTFFYDTKGENTALNLAISPWITYSLSDSWKILTWATVDHQLHYGADRNHWQPWGSNFIRVGPLWSASDHLQIYPCLQMYMDNPTWKNTTLGFEISASL